MTEIVPTWKKYPLIINDPNTQIGFPVLGVSQTTSTK